MNPSSLPEAKKRVISSDDTGVKTFVVQRVVIAPDSLEARATEIFGNGHAENTVEDQEIRRFFEEAPRFPVIQLMALGETGSPVISSLAAEKKE